MKQINLKSDLPHQQRVIDEANELADKILKLTAFISDSPIFQSVSYEEKFRMTKQLVFMDAYFNVLKERIDNF